LLLVAGLALAPLSGCFWMRTQLWPGPMGGEQADLPPGDAELRLPGPEEVSVLRHADPVRVRPAGALAGYPLAFFEKRARLTAGGCVIVAPGGRAEVLWPSGSAIVLFGQGLGWVGSPSRGEALFEFQDVDGARLDLVPGDRVQLLGGAILTGDSGPYMLDRESDDTLRIRNQSEARVQVAFREETFELDPGQSLTLPLLSAGGAPLSPDLGLQRVAGPGFAVHVRGPVEVQPSGEGVRVNALPERLGERFLRGLGVSVRLREGEAALFTGLSTTTAAPPAPAQDPPARAPSPPPGP
jgi:hypothetical protein